MFVCNTRIFVCVFNCLQFFTCIFRVDFCLNCQFGEAIGLIVFIFWLQNMLDKEFFTEYGEASQYEIQEVVGKGSYGVVGSAIDTHTGERVAIKKINDVFEHVSDATRILREIKLLRLLHHPDIVEIKHIMLPPSRREFKDIYVVFELMESDLHQVIKANDDLTPEHHQFFLYQLLRALKYIHTGVPCCFFTSETESHVLLLPITYLAIFQLQQMCSIGTSNPKTFLLMLTAS